MKRRISCAAVLFLVTSPLFAWNPFAPKISFERRIPAPHNLGPAKKVVLVEARGDDDQIRRFVSDMLDYQKFGTIAIVDGRASDTRIDELVGHRSRIEPLLQRWPDADAFLGVRMRGCDSQQRSGTTTEKDKDGNKRTVTEYWVKADCTAEIRIVDAATAREVVNADVSGDDESVHSKNIYSSTTDSTIRQAAGDAGKHAYSSFAPRKDRQTLVLEKSAPSFKDGMNRINANDYEGARKIWEEALNTNPNSAQLHLNFAEVNEVLGKTDEAKKHYEEAVRLDPSDNNRRWLAEFQKRQEEDASLLKKP